MIHIKYLATCDECGRDTLFDGSEDTFDSLRRLLKQHFSSLGTFRQHMKKVNGWEITADTVLCDRCRKKKR